MYQQEREREVLAVEITLDAYSLSKKRKEVVTGSQMYGLRKYKYRSEIAYTATLNYLE